MLPVDGICLKLALLCNKLIKIEHLKHLIFYAHCFWGWEFGQDTSGMAFLYSTVSGASAEKIQRMVMSLNVCSLLYLAPEPE